MRDHFCDKKFLIFILTSLVVIVKCQDGAFVSEILSSKKSNTRLKFGGNEYYFGVSSKVNFFDAFRLCKLDGMDLVYIDSYEENERLGVFTTQIGKGHSHFWTSGNNLHDFQEWSWLSTAKLIGYANWYPGQPDLGASGNDTTERCVEARILDKGGFTWNNVPCERLYYYICKSVKSNCSN